MFVSTLFAVVVTFINLSIVKSDTNSDVTLIENSEVQEFVPLAAVRHKITTLKESKEAEIKKAEYESNVARAEAILKKYNSPFTGLGYIIVQKTQECGGDFRVLLAIAGNESGFGRIPYKTYNPFGYLNGVQYSSWEEALSILSCKIAQQYLVPCNNSPECMVRRYAGDGDDREKWVRNINWFTNQI